LSLLEVMISLLVMAVLMTAALRTVGQSRRSQRAVHEQQAGRLLAQELLSEILRQAYREPFEQLAFGPEATENTGDRSVFDDVDDYHGWSATPPQDAAGAPLAGFEEWGRAVQVHWVDPEAPDSVVGSDQGVKRITVSASYDGQVVGSVVSLRCSASLAPWESAEAD
jgi:type II secretory pathway pseudopilin PulG